MPDLGNILKGALIGDALNQLFAEGLEALPSCSRHDEHSRKLRAEYKKYRFARFPNQIRS
jgi:hypothetical protein